MNDYYDLVWADGDRFSACELVYVWLRDKRDERMAFEAHLVSCLRPIFNRQVPGGRGQ